MSDHLRRSLARAAGDGDLVAARKLVALLEREDAFSARALSPETKVQSLTDSDFGAPKKWGRRVRCLNLIHRAWIQKNVDFYRARNLQTPLAELDLERVTLSEVASMAVSDFQKARDCGPTLLAAIESVLSRAGLTFLDGPTLLPMASPLASSSGEGPRT